MTTDYVMVPREPTEEMRAAGANWTTYKDDAEERLDDCDKFVATRVYKAMISASPQHIGSPLRGADDGSPSVEAIAKRLYCLFGYPSGQLDEQYVDDVWNVGRFGVTVSDEEKEALRADAKFILSALSPSPAGPSIQTVTEIRAAALEEAAKIAEAHVGAAERDRAARKQNFMSPEARESIRDEERGETIASQIIAQNIRAALPTGQPK